MPPHESLIRMATGYWESERGRFSQFRATFPGSDHRDWQPAKWQSLSRVRRTVLDHAEAAGHPVHSALELGCGSATLLIQLALGGVAVEGIDRDPDALAVAADSLASLTGGEAPAGRVSFRQDDFLRAGFSRRARADLVLSIGVIEHFDQREQQRVLRLHGEASRRWVLIAVPNLDSPVFRTFLSARARQGALYEDAHQPIDVPELADACGYRLAVDDGCHLFLSHRSDRYEVDDELAAFDQRMREQLTRRDPRRFAEYPDIDLCRGDIETLAAVEDAAGVQVRRRFGFLRWYLLDRAA